MIKLRWLKKKDGTKVLQQEKNVAEDIYTAVMRARGVKVEEPPRWIDVPIKEEE